MAEPQIEHKTRLISGGSVKTEPYSTSYPIYAVTEKYGDRMAENSFYNKVYEAVLRIPEGKVATYGQVAAAAGNGGAARAAGNALHVNPAFGIVPCHRVVNSKGDLAPGFAFGGTNVQKEMLEAEGVEVNDNRVDLKKYQVKELK